MLNPLILSTFLAITIKPSQSLSSLSQEPKELNYCEGSRR